MLADNSLVVNLPDAQQQVLVKGGQVVVENVRGNVRTVACVMTLDEALQVAQLIDQAYNDAYEADFWAEQSERYADYMAVRDDVLDRRPI